MTPIIHDLDQDIEFDEELRVLSKHEPEAETDEEFSPEFMLSSRPYAVIGEAFLIDPNGPTGHGDICYSDADPGL